METTVRTRTRPIKQCESCNIVKNHIIELYKCSRCMCVYYCSIRCQRKDYKQHKPQCVGSNSFIP